MPRSDTTTPHKSEVDASDRDPFLVSLGERVRSLRARKGMTRRALAAASEVSERHLANLEAGSGNASILVLRQVASALSCELAELVGDETAASPEGLLIRDLLRGRNESELHQARLALSELYGAATPQETRRRRIALIGLRGAGKSTLGVKLAEALQIPFVELNTEIERVAGCGLNEIHNLLGLQAYRRYERRALEATIHHHADAVIATPGGIVSDPSTFNLLLANCYTVWLKAAPADHMQRVIDQGDLRPMSGNREAMDDLKRILEGRALFYGKADATYDTHDESPDQSLSGLAALLQQS